MGSPIGELFSDMHGGGSAVVGIVYHAVDTLVGCASMITEGWVCVFRYGHDQR